MSNSLGLDFLLKLCVNNGWSPRYCSVLQLYFQVWLSSFKSQLAGFNSQIYRPRVPTGISRTAKNGLTIPLSCFNLHKPRCSMFVLLSSAGKSKIYFSVREVLFLISLIAQPFMVDKICNSNCRCPKRNIYNEDLQKTKIRGNY